MSWKHELSGWVQPHVRLVTKTFMRSNTETLADMKVETPWRRSKHLNLGVKGTQKYVFSSRLCSVWTNRVQSYTTLVTEACVPPDERRLHLYTIILNFGMTKGKHREDKSDSKNGVICHYVRIQPLHLFEPSDHSCIWSRKTLWVIWTRPLKGYGGVYKQFRDKTTVSLPRTLYLALYTKAGTLIGLRDYLNRQHPKVTRATSRTTGPVPADSRG